MLCLGKHLRSSLGVDYVEYLPEYRLRCARTMYLRAPLFVHAPAPFSAGNYWAATELDLWSRYLGALLELHVICIPCAPLKVWGPSALGTVQRDCKR